MLWRSSRGRPINAPAAFIHPCQPIVANQRALEIRIGKRALQDQEAASWPVTRNAGKKLNVTLKRATAASISATVSS
jgi:hypothetical protein